MIKLGHVGEDYLGKLPLDKPVHVGEDYLGLFFSF
jgi:hypothetical protein